MTKNIYDVAIVGAGVTGTALLYVLSHYTNIKSIALLEKYETVASVNSNKINNSQTLHMGDIETNYTVEKAANVKEGAELVAAYVEKIAPQAYRKMHKMVLAVGDKEVQELEQRYEEFRHLFPQLKKINRKHIAKIEPNVVKERNPTENILALYSEDGFAIDFGKLAESFVEQAQKKKDRTIDVLLGTRVRRIKKEHNTFIITTDSGDSEAKTVVVAAGSQSLQFAYDLGYGKEFILLPVAGNFFCAPKVLNGKVYTMQIKKLPFAAVHGDPAVDNLDETRFGPTMKVLPVLERRKMKTTMEFLRLFEFRLDAILSLLKILADKTIFLYILKNLLYDIPIIGKRIFVAKEMRKIVPSIGPKDVRFGKGLGGIRPQIVDVKKKAMVMGEGKIVGDNIIFDLTPSPGASVCLKNAEVDAKKLIEFLGRKFTFDKAKFERELRRTE